MALRTTCFVAIFGIFLGVHSSLLAQLPRNSAPKNPADAFQKMFDEFSSQFGKTMPGFVGEMSPEQKEALARVAVSEAEEAKLGKKTLDTFLENLSKQKIKVLRDGRDVAYLRHLTKLIQPHMARAKRYSDFDVQVIVSDSEDAFSIPGGHLLFTTGLLEAAESEAAVVGVVAHELSHLDREHQLLMLKQSKLMANPTKLSDAMLAIATFSRPFRPEQEAEADSDAVRWMIQAGYEPKELAKLLHRWGTRQSNDTPWMKFVPGFVKSHPDPDRRAEKILEQAQKDAVPNLVVGRESLAKRTVLRKKN